MKFFNIDCHISVIADIKNIFENLGHQVDQWSISGHRHIFNLPESKSNIVNEKNWINLDETIVDIKKFILKHPHPLKDIIIASYGTGRKLIESEEPKEKFDELIEPIEESHDIDKMF
jgi:hypothetical protein